VILFALTKIGHQYFLFGGAGLICLVAFVTLILSPALSAHGRIWEKAAAGFLSIFVLATLLVVGVVVGLLVVRYYNEIGDLIHGK
jgi:cell division protein FtsW (lipid II flippase)